MSVQKRGNGWRVRWQEGDRWRSRTFSTKRDALLFDGDLRRKRRLGELARLDAGTESLDTYVAGTWALTHAPLLAPVTRQTYAALYDAQVSPSLGSISLRELTPDLIARWQADRLAAGVGPASVQKSLALLGSVLQRAAESGRIVANPARLVRKAKMPRRAEVRPLAPLTIEKMRAVSTPRDAALLSVLAYAGLRPGEAACAALAGRARADVARGTRGLAGCGEGHQDGRSSHGAAAGASRRRSARVEDAKRSPRRRRADLPRPRRQPVERAGVSIVASARVHGRSDGCWHRCRAHI